MDHHNSDAAADDDVVWGAGPIGRVINRNPRQTYHLLQTGVLPARKIGEQWVGSRKQPRAAIVGDTAATTAA